jgi:hypothetical protein
MILRYLRQASIGILVLAATAIAQPPQVQVLPGTPNNQKFIQAQVEGAAGLNSDARAVRAQLMGIFQQYPPSVRQIFQLDPTLLTNANYLAMYPGLAAYLTQHPEIAHNPTFYIGTPEAYGGYGGYQDDSIGRNISRIIEPLAVAAVVITMISIFGWIIRAIMNHRRWLRVSKLQTDMQNKLLERFTSNEEMLAFIGTAAGQRFLESASVPSETGPKNLSAPVGRILWSIQLGIVILVGGVGLVIVSYQLSDFPEGITTFQVIGGIIIALGIGFILSALGSFLLSRRLGLMDPAPSPTIK